jgi:hypothetical protein
MPRHDPPELAPINRLEKTCKDAIEELHARPFLSLDNQQGSGCTDSAEHAPCQSESFPGQPCALGEQVFYQPRPVRAVGLPNGHAAQMIKATTNTGLPTALHLLAPVADCHAELPALEAHQHAPELVP